MLAKEQLWLGWLQRRPLLPEKKRKSRLFSQTLSSPAVLFTDLFPLVFLELASLERRATGGSRILVRRGRQMENTNLKGLAKRDKPCVARLEILKIRRFFSHEMAIFDFFQ